MNFLKAEIERKKRQIAEKNVCQPNKKYFKRGDLAAIQEAEYLAKYGPSIEDIEELEEKKKEALKEKGMVDAEDALYPLPREDVVAKLREKGEPILIFGETEDKANLRLRSLEIGEGDSFKVKNTGNNFVEALKKVDKEYLKAVVKDDATTDDKNKMELKLYNTNRTWSELLELANDLRRGDHKHDEMVVSEWMKVIMTMWGHELNDRHEMEKITVKGRMDGALFKQTMGYLKPLLKMLRKGTLSDDIRDSLTSMVKNIMHRDYIRANEKYMEMAIGNAPWPIGVTNAGIHARPGRERINTKHVAHVLNDESQRKYIQVNIKNILNVYTMFCDLQGLKRLMTKCQQFFVTDPSRCVDFQRRETDPDPEPRKEAGVSSMRKVAFTSEKGDALDNEDKEEK